MWNRAYGIGSVIILVLFGFYFWPQINETVEQVDFEIPTLASYACADGASIRASFFASSVQLQLSDGRILSLARMASASGDEIGYRTLDGSIEFWTRDFSAFVTEGKLTTYASCRDTTQPLLIPTETEVATTSEELPD